MYVKRLIKIDGGEIELLKKGKKRAVVEINLVTEAEAKEIATELKLALMNALIHKKDLKDV